MLNLPSRSRLTETWFPLPVRCLQCKRVALNKVPPEDLPLYLRSADGTYSDGDSCLPCLREAVTASLPVVSGVVSTESEVNE